MSNANNNNNTSSLNQTSATLASKPHSFSGAVLTPEHARSLHAGHVLSLASALSLQAANAAMVRLSVDFLVRFVILVGGWCCSVVMMTTGWRLLQLFGPDLQRTVTLLIVWCFISNFI